MTDPFKGVNLEEEARIWFKKLTNIIHRSFPKIKISSVIQNDEIHKTMLERSKFVQMIENIKYFCPRFWQYNHYVTKNVERFYQRN